MKKFPDRYRLACAAATLLLITGCNDSDDPPVVPVATTTNVSTTVVDGAISNALVCLDKSADGKCDADETRAGPTPPAT